MAALKIASGCDRRCAFCAIPSFRGAFVSRPAAEIVSEAQWLAGTGVREIVLVSENSTSYGKDLSQPGALVDLLGQLGEVEGVERIRVAYLQPAEIRPGLIEAMTAHERVANHFDLSFQHASPSLLRRMRRFGGTESFLDLVGRIRALAPEAGIRSNVIVGLPGETPADVDELLDFLSRAELDAVGVFGYSDEEGTAAADMPDKLGEREIRARVEEVASLVDEVMAQRAEQRIGQPVTVLVEAVSGIVAEGRAEHQGAEDSTTTLHLTPQDRAWVQPGSHAGGQGGVQRRGRPARGRGLRCPGLTRWPALRGPIRRRPRCGAGSGWSPAGRSCGTCPTCSPWRGSCSSRCSGTC